MATSSTGTGTGAGGLRASGFDPQSPSALMLVGDDAASASDGGGLSVLYSDDGVGCNQYETAALLRMLDARDEILASGGGGGGGPSPGPSGLRALSREYRRSVRDCMAGWEEQLASEESPSAEEEERSADNLELLKVSSAFVHLSEIYLLPRGDNGSTSTGRSGSSGPNAMDIDDGGGAVSNSSSNIPGSATADTVRFLRYEFENPDSVFVVLGTTSEEVETMVKSEIPEHYSSGATGDTLFWSLVEAYALRGCLREAWAILTHHSAARRVHAAALRGDFDDPSAGATEPFLIEDRDALEILKGIMLGAPLPGGIDTENDHGLGDADDDDDDVDGANAMHGLDQDDDEDDIRLVKGVARRAYQLWDQSSETYHPRTAANTHQTWQTAVGRLMTQAGPVQRMMHHTPRLRRLLSILRGQFDGITFHSWEENLRAELLYVRPSVRPNDIATRAGIAMKKFQSDDEKEKEQMIMFNIMSGDAGSAIASLQWMGGSSGAALPTTLASLLCNLLTSAGSIQPSQLTYDLQTHLLLEASSSILSSFAAQSQHDVGVRLSARLILPYATPDNVRVAATLAETLGRHAPRSDAETRDLLTLCEDLIVRGSVRVADACDSLCYCRYQHHADVGKAGGAAHWLLTGAEIWTSVRSTLDEAKGKVPSPLEVELAGACGRRFVTVCMETARSLLSELAMPSSGQALAHYCKVGKEMLEAIMEGDLAHLIRREQSTALLQHICDIADAIKDDDRSALAESIVDCLDEKVDKEVSGSVDILAPPSMRANLLKAALTYILEKEDTKFSADNNLKEAQEDSSTKSFAVPASSFDVRGVQALMARLTELTYNASFSPVSMRSANLGGKKATASSPANLPFDEEKMRLALCNGLERAFVSENAKRKEASKPQSLTAGVTRQVDLMLGPSM